MWCHFLPATMMHGGKSAVSPTGDPGPEWAVSLAFTTWSLILVSTSLLMNVSVFVFVCFWIILFGVSLPHVWRFLSFTMFEMFSATIPSNTSTASPLPADFSDGMSGPLLTAWSVGLSLIFQALFLLSGWWTLLLLPEAHWLFLLCCWARPGRFYWCDISSYQFHSVIFYSFYFLVVIFLHLFLCNV